MRTFEELKTLRINAEELKISIAKETKEKNFNWVSRFNCEEQIKKSSKVIENIEETITIEIAYYANVLYNNLLAVYSTSKFSLSLYAILKKHVDELRKNTLCWYSKENNCELLKVLGYFNFTEEDLQRINDKKSNLMFKDELMNFINNVYGTFIPLSQEWNELMLDKDLKNETACREQNRKFSLLKLKNGQLVDGSVYPLVYQKDILNVYGVLQEQSGSVLTKKLTPPRNK